MARVPKVARRTIFRGRPRLRNFAKINDWIGYFQKVAMKFRHWSCTEFYFSTVSITKLFYNIPSATISSYIFTDLGVSFMSTGFMHANGIFFTCMTTENLFSEQYFKTTNRNSTHGKDIAHVSSRIDKVEINNCSKCNISYTKTNAME